MTVRELLQRLEDHEQRLRQLEGASAAPTDVELLDFLATQTDGTVFYAVDVSEAAAAAVDGAAREFLRRAGCGTARRLGKRLLAILAHPPEGGRYVLKRIFKDYRGVLWIIEPCLTVRP